MAVSARMANTAVISGAYIGVVIPVSVASIGVRVAAGITSAITPACESRV
jgi:hypothetical protein